MNLYTEEVIKQVSIDFFNRQHFVANTSVSMFEKRFWKFFKQNYQPTPQWNSIESAPKDGSEILVSDEEGTHKVFFGSIYSGRDYGWCVDGSYGSGYYNTIDNPTHWMPVPELPKPPKS